MQMTNANDSMNVTPIQKSFPGDGFYNTLSLKIKNDPLNPVISRTAVNVDYIFSVASEDLNTYIEVYEPSLAIVQERPPFSNIHNGVGLFSSRYINEIDSVTLGVRTMNEILVNPLTAPLKFQ
jgi:hypothetical protein